MQSDKGRWQHTIERRRNGDEQNTGSGRTLVHGVTKNALNERIELRLLQGTA
jgi:hypothetical protein